MSWIARTFLLSLSLLALGAFAGFPSYAEESDDEIPPEEIAVPEGETPLLHAIRAGDEVAVRRLLLQRARVNEADSEGNTPLLTAVSYGNVPMVPLLVRAGANLRVRDSEGRAVMHHAIAPEMVALLLRLGAEIDPRDNEGATPLMRLTALSAGIVLGSPAEVRKCLGLLLKAGAKADAQDRSGSTPLMYLARGYISTCMPYTDTENANRVVQIYRSAGVRLEQTDHEGRTALICAARARRMQMLQALLGVGANVRARDRHGRSALTHLARLGKQDSTVVDLLQRGATVGLMEALLFRDQELASRLIARRAGIHRLGPNGETALALCAEREYPELVEQLLQRKLKVNASDEEGHTALILAIGGRNALYLPMGRTEWSKRHVTASPIRRAVIAQLLRARANVNVVSRVSVACLEATALDAALDLKDAETAQLLRAGGALTAEELEERQTRAASRR